MYMFSEGCVLNIFCTVSSYPAVQACPGYMSLLRRHKLLRRLCVQLLTEMRRVYGPEAGVTPTQVEGLMKQHPVLMLYRQVGLRLLCV